MNIPLITPFLRGTLKHCRAKVKVIVFWNELFVEQIKKAPRLSVSKPYALGFSIGVTKR